MKNIQMTESQDVYWAIRLSVIKTQLLAGQQKNVRNPGHWISIKNA